MWAHSGRKPDRSHWQPLSDHLHATAELAAELAGPLGLSRTARLAAMVHDLGKFHPDFVKRLMGLKVRIDHSTAGGAVLMAGAAGHDKIVAELIAYAVLGHHAGLPDMINDSDACVQARDAGITSCRPHGAMSCNPT
ncbi:MAG: CRISPR-associated endonuclease Cas3'' [Paracoccus sp. (in: a-proteobacteria)]|nr:CRISPR-associated endonuclease Cas3'' [Paracoccus sp. (in: a-proteobacteria)]